MLPMTDKMYQWGYEARGLADEEHHARLAELNRPFKGNPPELYEPTKVRVLRAFYVNNKPAEKGHIVTVPHHLAQELVAIKKAELIT